MDGFRLCHRLQQDERTRAIPVVFMTISSIPEDRVKAYKVGGVDYITKPIQWEELLARVSTQLQIQKLSKQVEQTKNPTDPQSEHVDPTQPLMARIATLEEENRRLMAQPASIEQLTERAAS